MGIIHCRTAFPVQMLDANSATARESINALSVIILRLLNFLPRTVKSVQQKNMEMMYNSNALPATLTVLHVLGRKILIAILVITQQLTIIPKLIHATSAKTCSNMVMTRL